MGSKRLLLKGAVAKRLRIVMEKEFLPRDKKLNIFSRNLRNNMTKQEKRLWYDFLKGQSQQFNRQRVIGEYIVDFYCDKLKLVVELDGSQHYGPETVAYDRQRTAFLKDLRLTVLRFSNFDVDRDFEGVCMSILNHHR